MSINGGNSRVKVYNDYPTADELAQMDNRRMEREMSICREGGTPCHYNGCTHCDKPHVKAPSDMSPVVKRRAKRNGFVYLVRGAQYYKIGVSVDVRVRIEQIRPLLPFPLEILAVVKASDMRKLESYWHSRFRDKRLEGEWFGLSCEDVTAFCSQSGVSS